MTDIAIFTMEKVGSSTIMRAVKSAGLDAHKIYPGNVHKFYIGHFSKIITAVRDPVARNISAKFEFDRLNLHDEMPFTWFDDYILHYLDIDVYATPFNRKEGWKIYDDRLLVIRTEDLTDKLAIALSDFLEVPASRFVVGHRGNGKEKFGLEYEKYLAEAKFDKELLDWHYDTKYAKHFYYVRELKEFRKKWSKK